MVEKAQRLITEVARRAFRHDGEPPINTTKMIDWVDHNPEAFQQLVSQFDQLITDFNQTYLADVPAHFINLRKVKETLGETQLPTVKSLMESTRLTEVKTLIKVMTETDVLMRRGQLPKEQRPRPYLSYHVTKTDVQNLVIGAIVHGYEDFMAQTPELRGKLGRDELVDMFIELASRHSDSPLFHALSGVDALNWVDDYSKLSSDFRKMHGFS